MFRFIYIVNDLLKCFYVLQLRHYCRQGSTSQKRKFLKPKKMNIVLLYDLFEWITTEDDH